MEKSPLDTLKEWQETASYISQNVRQELLTPDNSLSVRLEWDRDVIFNRVHFIAEYNLNGLFRRSETELSLLSLRPENIPLHLAEGVRELAQKISREISGELETQMMSTVLKNENLFYQH